MSEIMNKAGGFLRSNIIWIVTILTGLILVYFDARYTSYSDLEKVKTGYEIKIDKLEEEHDLEVEALKDKISSNEKAISGIKINGGHQVTRLDNLEGRVDKKIKLIKENTQAIDDNENLIIWIQARQDIK